jgi:hypothetical protein
MKAEMSEVDRLSNSGLYPILPMGDRKGHREDARHPPPGDPKEREKPRVADATTASDNDDPPGDPPRPPKSLIDEYA